MNKNLLPFVFCSGRTRRKAWFFLRIARIFILLTK